MFVGHFAAAFAAKRAARRPSLGWLVAACQWPDLIWPMFVLAGVERLHIEPDNSAFLRPVFDHYPWSHSLVMDLLWAVALGALYVWRRHDLRGGVVMGALVLSHWVLDWITHRPDLPLVPGWGPKVGLGLWNSVPGTVAVETLMYFAAIAVYLRSTRARDRIGSVAFWTLAALLFALSLANLSSAPPPSANAVAMTALTMWLFVLWGAWIDRHRAATAEQSRIPMLDRERP